MKKDKHIESSRPGDKKRSLPEIPKKQAFVVPEGYFEKLPFKIQERIHTPKGSLWKELATFILKPNLVIRALLVLIVLSIGAYYFFKPLLDNPEIAVNPEKTMDLKEEKIIKEISAIKKEEVARHIEVIEEQLLVAQIEADTILESTVLMNEDPIAATNTEEVEYLIENDIDVSFIIDELQRN